MLQILARARLRVNDRIMIGAQLRHQHLIVLGWAFRTARIAILGLPFDPYHGRSDTQRAVPLALGACVCDAGRGAGLGGGCNTAGDGARDAFVIKAEGGADFDGDADGVGVFLGELAVYIVMVGESGS